jgi:septum formation protein
LGLEFQVIWPDVDEIQHPGERVEAFVQRAAREKATAVAEQLTATAQSPAWVIGADTLVVVDDTPLGKPGDGAEAEAMLQRLSGRDHRVLTGWALVHAPSLDTTAGLEETRVWFKPLRRQSITAYVETGEGLDKAGSYGIQGLGCFLVQRIEGNYENVVGLPACAIVEALLAVGALSRFPVAEASVQEERR